MVRLLLLGLILLSSNGCVDTTVTRPYQEEDLTIREIRKKLQSGDFRQKLEASKQIDKLAVEEKLRVLIILSQDAEASTRLLAVKKLAKIEDPRAEARLSCIPLMYRDGWDTETGSTPTPFHTESFSPML